VKLASCPRWGRIMAVSACCVLAHCPSPVLLLDVPLGHSCIQHVYTYLLHMTPSLSCRCCGPPAADMWRFNLSYPHVPLGSIQDAYVVPPIHSHCLCSNPAELCNLGTHQRLALSHLILLAEHLPKLCLVL
jgi:hypothetical protein